MTRRVVPLLAVLLAASCGAPLMKLPAGPGVAAANAASALAEATAVCRPITTLTAEIGVSGSVGGRRMRGRLLAGLAAPSSVRLEAPAPFGQPLFIFVARGNDATVLLPRNRRVLEHGRADDVLEAVTGVSMTPEELRRTLTGCADAEAIDEARDFGNGWLVIPGSRRVYLRRARPGDPWRIVAAIAHDSAGSEWRAEYTDFSNGLPRAIRLASAEPRRFNLRLLLSQIETNVPLPDEAFRVQIPASADPITLADLRDAGPLADMPANVNAR
jgi:outer membrane lipoprotein-sorting protein